MAAIWWTLLGGVAAGLLGLELRRVRRDHAAERDGPHLYARYAANDPHRPIGAAEIDLEAHLAPPANVPPPAPIAVQRGTPHKRRRKAPRVGAGHR